jgi:hypothetical protein
MCNLRSGVQINGRHGLCKSLSDSKQRCARNRSGGAAEISERGGSFEREASAKFEQMFKRGSMKLAIAIVALWLLCGLTGEMLAGAGQVHFEHVVQGPFNLARGVEYYPDR